jgi:uncharacterized SAM-binding protein YcdF (DUF218 family)
METPDAIVVLAGGIKQGVSGRWVSTDLTDADDTLGAPGGKTRVLATAVLATAHPTTTVIASGGKGFDVPKDAPENRPLLAEILRDELVECGVPVGRIVLESDSNTTYQALECLGALVAERDWRNIVIVTSRYHLPRLRAIVEAKFPELGASLRLVSAEEILSGVDPVRYKTAFADIYASAFMKERIAREERGIMQIKDGTYQF